MAAVFVVAVMVAALLPPIPFTGPSPTDDGSTPCACDCGEAKGRCCCVAPRASALAFRCSERSEPMAPTEGVDGGKIIGPPAVVDVIRPEPTSDDSVAAEGLFSGPDLRPEIPPPRT